MSVDVFVLTCVHIYFCIMGTWTGMVVDGCAPVLETSCQLFGWKYCKAKTQTKRVMSF